MEAEPYQVKGVIFPYEEEMTPERIGELLRAARRRAHYLLPR